MKNAVKEPATQHPAKAPITDTASLRKFLIDQMVSAAKGEIEVGAAKSVCNLAQQIYNTVKLEVAFAQVKVKGVAVEPVSFGSQPPTKSLRVV
jgi:hypothetical protein